MITRFLVSLLIIVLAAFCFGFQESALWARFSTPDNSCSVLMPDSPKNQHETKDTESGKVLNDIWISNGSSGLFLLGITDYPIDVDQKSELEADRDNFLSAVHAKLVDESDITVDGIPGKEFTGVSDSRTFRSRVFLIKRRVFQIVGAQPTSELNSDMLKKFLESFQFNKK